MTKERSYDSDLAALFVQTFEEAARAARNLVVSIHRTSALFPLTGEKLSSLDDEGLERLDAFRVRYAQLQDLIANKLFRTLLRLEEETTDSMLDVLNAMDKRGIIASFESWKTLRELRNAFMHDYPGQADLRALALTRAHGLASELPAILGRVRRRAVKSVGLSAAQLPEVAQ